MNLNKEIYINTQTSINGDGLYYPAISLYFSGCDKKVKCPDCHNPELQSPLNGYKTTISNLINDIDSSLIKWFNTYKTMALVFLGGEALAPWNREASFIISQYFKHKYKDNIKNIFYSWRYLKDLKEVQNYIKYMDIGILGEFNKELLVINQVPSTSNQYIYDFNKKTKLPNIIKEEN